MAISPSALRADIYRILDEILDTGQPVEIIRKGQTLRIVLDAQRPRTERLVSRADFILGDPDDLDTVTWTDQWDGPGELDES